MHVDERWGCLLTSALSGCKRALHMFGVFVKWISKNQLAETKPWVMSLLIVSRHSSIELIQGNKA